MLLVRIFTPRFSDFGLWSIQLNGKQQNEFEQFFDSSNDVEWLHYFFQENEADLNNGFFGNMTIGDAILRTLDEVEEMEDTLYDYTEQGFSGKNGNLQHLFKPLNNFEYAVIVHQKSKARIRRGWLRLYAIRLSENCFIITGGAIKLSPDMKRKHLQYELRKIEQTKAFLLDNGIDYPSDLNQYNND